MRKQPYQIAGTTVLRRVVRQKTCLLFDGRGESTAKEPAETKGAGKLSCEGDERDQGTAYEPCSGGNS